MQPGAWPGSQGTWGGQQNPRGNNDPERIICANARGGFNITWGEMFQWSRDAAISDRGLLLIRCPCGPD